MHHVITWLPLAVFLGATTALPAQETIVPFREQEIDKSLKVGYAVLLVDLNADGRKEVVVVDTTRVVWFENPSWKMRTIIQGQTKPDNVCIAAHDVDGDGQVDLALGADWRPANTKDGGTIQWLKRGRSLDDPWTLHPIDAEPTVHRIRFVDLDGSGRPHLVVAPLFGQNSTPASNWMDAPVRLLAYEIPKDPVRERWQRKVLCQSLHVMHNFCPFPRTRSAGSDLLTASYEGVSWLRPAGSSENWAAVAIGAGNQANGQGSRGASEVKLGRLKSGRPFIATIEPWHGNQVVVYTPSNDDLAQPWRRQVLDEQLKWGHAVWCADLTGDGGDELIIGVRDDLSPEARRGVRVFQAKDEAGTEWRRQVVDAGGVAVEDLAAADLDGDGKIDLVAVGRATGNVRIYWNARP